MIPQHSSDTPEHYTPAYIVEPAHDVLGLIELDPASCSLAQRTVRAVRWYGFGSPYGEDGLAEVWEARTAFLNPPGGRVDRSTHGTASSAAAWYRRFADAWLRDAIGEALFIGFTLEIVRSVQGLNVVQPALLPFCVPKKRIPFDTVDEEGNRVPSKQPTHANIIVYFPPGDRASKMRLRFQKRHLKRFSDAFAPIGVCRT